jgi:hypothetical protein
MSPKALIGILAGIILLVVVVYYSLPKSGKQVLEAEVAAMNGAQSWRIRTEMQSMGGAVTRTHVAICPDREHIVEEGRGLRSEYIRIGDDIYYRRGATEWKRGMPNSSYFFMNILTARPCLTNPKEPNAKVPGGAEELREWIAEDIKLARITKGDEKFENDESCREWTVTQVQTVQLRSLKQEYVVCINEKDHLPRTMTATGGFVTHYEWNPSLVIEAPDMSARPMSAPETP